ncbi:MAG: FAD-binding oxidoreductase [Betaproteobacteria bacterium]|nr:FAD-binding oxidoreductase [Betaproteobacteria bacterium]
MPAYPALAEKLRSTIRGEVRFDAGSRATYSADASNYRQVPIGVVIPRSVEDIVETLRLCREFGAPILPRGGGTSQNGQCVNVAVVVDTSKYLNRVLEVDEAARTARVEPGAVCDVLRDAAEAHRLTFGPDPATHSRCTLGGMIGNNSCGAHSVMAGKTSENIESLEILTYDGARFWVGPTSDAELDSIIRDGGRRGEIYGKLKALRDQYADLIRAKFPKIKRRVSGYSLDQLLPENGFNVARALVGSEGTCVTVLQARTKLVKSPQGRVLLVLGYPDIYAAGDAVPRIMAHRPIALEGLDWRIIGGLRERGLRLNDIALLPEGQAWLMCELGADTREEAAQEARRIMAELSRTPNGPSSLLLEDPLLQTRIWGIRETGASATALSLAPDEPDPVVGWEDAAVEPARVGDYLREFQALIDKYHYKTSLYGHFGDGCIHARITFDLRSEEGIRTWRRFLMEAAELVVKYGGSLSGEHGDGQAKGELLPIMYGEELMQAFREFKAIWDPGNKMNPGKLIDAYPLDSNLRLGPDYRPAQPATRFVFPWDGRRFSRSLERCIGMGRCRAVAGGTMCPSYRATGEERYSTRGRSRLLFEMLQGEVVTEGWASDAVKEALDLCLACKGCKSDCPTHVDMATYKAEFLSHYYEGKARPRQAYSMGMIGSWVPLAGKLPRLANFLTRAPVLGDIAKAVAGIAKERSLPRFSAETFRHRFARPARTSSTLTAERRRLAASSSNEGEGRGGGELRPRVILWADTFNNHFRSETALAAAEVLEHAGCEVIVPRKHLCCGRPLYDFGFLDRAKAQLAEILDHLAPYVDEGIPVVGLEPSCLSVFRDELPNLFPDDPRAKRLAAQSFMLADYLVRNGYRPPKLTGTALVHGHCHQKASLGMEPELRLLREMGLQVSAPDTGCCGMAGAFGFRPEHYPLSQKIGETVLFPALRALPDDALIVTNGFSCREQIEQALGRKTLHVAEVLQLALNRSPGD